MFYLDLFAALNRHQVSYVLIGGLAVALHGVERNTMDVDVCVVVSPANLAHLVAAAQELRLQPALPVPLSALEDIEALHPAGTPNATCKRLPCAATSWRA